MYERFYGLKEKPFALTPDPDFFFKSAQHSAALTMLDYGLYNQAGFTVITGGVGCGKTTLMSYLLFGLESSVSAGVITNTHPAPGDLLKWTLLAFGLDYSGLDKIQQYRRLTEFLLQQKRINRRSILVIDEAQVLSLKDLEELRLLSNVNAGKHHLLQLILLGQPQLLEKLRRPELYQFAQRVVADYFIGPLEPAEAHAYIHHRLSVGGRTSPLFTTASCDSIHRYARGIPRLMNLICDTALVYGFGGQVKMVTSKIVDDVIRDKTKGKRIWRRRKPSRGVPTTLEKTSGFEG